MRIKLEFIVIAILLLAYICAFVATGDLYWLLIAFLGSMGLTAILRHEMWREEQAVIARAEWSRAKNL